MRNVPVRNRMSRLGLGHAAAAPVEYTEEQTTCLQAQCGYGAVRCRQGQRLTISNRNVIKLGFWLSKEGSPTGDVTFTIRKVSDDSIIVSKVWGDASEVPASKTYCEVTFDQATLINEEVRILAEFSGGNASNCINHYLTTSDVKGGEYFTEYSASYTDRPTWDDGYRYKYYEV